MNASPAPPPTAPLIEVHGLAKDYGSGGSVFRALRGVDLVVGRGEFVAIMGPSGSGKSTLMNLLGCLDTPTAGTYRYEGIAVEGLDNDQRSMLRRHALGFVFQGFNLLGRTSSLDNVALPLIYRGFSRAERRSRAAAALESVGLADRLGSLPGELSGGQQQRVAIARAIVTEPVTLFADEPTGNLDAETAARITDLIFGLNAEAGTALVLVTHDPELASRTGLRLRLRGGIPVSE